jgi:hypothetical protein
MKPGGSKNKGSAFERRICVTLSQWLTQGERTDLFSRNVLSGGLFTISASKAGIPGDLAAVHPIAYAFLEIFFVECKHSADIGLNEFMFKGRAKGLIGRTLVKVEEQAKQSGRRFLLIAKQNRWPELVITDENSGIALYSGTRTRFHICHANYIGSVYVSRLDDLIEHVSPAKVMHISKRSSGIPDA